MNINPKMTETKQSDQNSADKIAPSVFWGTIALNGITLLVYAYIFNLVLQQTKTLDIYAAATVMVFAIVAAIAGIILTIRQKQDLGVKLSLYPILVVGIIVISIFQGRTLPASFSILIISVVANMWLLQRQSRRMHLAATILALIAMWVIEWINPAWRISVNSASVGPAGAIAFLVIFGVAVGARVLRGNLRTKLVSAFLVVTIVPLAIISYLNYRSTTDALLQAANVKIASAAQVSAEQVDAFFSGTLNATRIKAQDPVIIDYLLLPAAQRAGSAEEAQVLKLLNAYNHENSLFINSIGVIDVQGESLVDTSPTEIGVNKLNRIYFQQAIKTGVPYSSELIFSATTGKPSLYFTAPVRNPADGSIIGVFRIRYDAGILQTIVAKNAGLIGEASLPVLLDENHIRLAHGVLPDLDYKTIVPLSADALAKLQANNSLPKGTAEQLSTNLPEFEAGLNNIAKQPFFIAELHEQGEGTEETTAVKLKSHPWIMVFGQTNTVFLAPIQAQTRNSLVVALVLAIAAAFLGLFIAQTMAGPVTRLTTVAEQIAGGDIQVQAKVETSDEIGLLAKTFNQMTAQLREFISTLEQRVADRTKALATSAEVSRSLSTILEQHQLVTEVVERVKTSFNYYHAHIYLTDEASGELVMAGGTGEAGATMLASGHKISKGKGLVGGAAETNKYVLVTDTSANPDWLPNPLLPETKSELAVPISIGDKVVGVLDVQHNIAGGLGKEDADLLQSIANQVAIALQNIKQAEIVVKRAAEMETVADISTATSTILDTQEMLQSVVDLTKERFDLYHTHIYLLNEAGNTLVLTAGAGEVGKKMVAEKRSIPLDREHSLVARAGRTRQGAIVNDVTKEPDFLPNPLLPDTRSEMAIPMVVGNKVVGVFDVQGSVVNRFTEEDVRIKTTLSSQVAIALENARQYGLTQSALAQSEKLFQASSKLTRSNDLQELTAVVVESLNVPAINRAILASLNYDTNGTVESMDVIANWWNGTGHDTSAVGTHYPSETVRIMQTFLSPTPVFYNDVFTDERMDAVTMGLAKSLNLRAVAVLPLIVGSSQLGVLLLEAETPYNFTSEETRLFTSLAPQLATVMENRRQYELAQKQADRESMLNTIGQKIQSATSVEAVLQIAARELGRALDAPLTIAQLGMHTKAGVGNPHNGNGNGNGH
jgi:GAF domain-containing protein/HAMP domain-containing protein